MSRWRFSVADLLVVTLGISGGLAYHRLPGVGWSDALLVMCATWIVVGMIQQARSAFVLWHSLPKVERELRNGAVLAIARPIVVMGLLAVAVRVVVAKELELDVIDSIALDAFTASLFSLAVILAYSAPGRSEIGRPAAKKTVVQFVVGVLAGFLGVIWLVYVLVETQTITGLVHLAIGGVNNAQPTRWNDKPFQAYDPQVQLLAAFFRWAFVAALAVAVSAISTMLLTIYWDRRRTRRILLTTAVLGWAVAGYLVYWYWTVAYPAVSPFLAAHTGNQPWYVVVAGISVFAGACFLFAMRYVPAGRLCDYRLPETRRPYHLSGAIMILLLIAMLISALPGWWNVPFINSLWGSPTLASDLRFWWDGGAGLFQLPQILLQVVYALASSYVEEPKMLLRLAAVLIVIDQIRRWRRGEIAAEALAPVHLGKFVTLTVLAAVTLLLAIPAGAWLGFAIVTTPIGGY